MRQARSDLNTFMFSSVYLNPIAKSEESKAQELICRLFEYYVKHPDLLGEEYQTIWQEEGPERAVCDYISGMTDRYAIDLYKELFIPNVWTSPR